MISQVNIIIKRKLALQNVIRRRRKTCDVEKCEKCRLRVSKQAGIRTAIDIEIHLRIHLSSGIVALSLSLSLSVAHVSTNKAPVRPLHMSEVLLHAKEKGERESERPVNLSTSKM